MHTEGEQVEENLGQHLQIPEGLPPCQIELGPILSHIKQGSGGTESNPKNGRGKKKKEGCREECKEGCREGRERQEDRRSRHEVSDQG